MIKKKIIGVLITVCLFISGVIIAIIGFMKGLDMASALARPKNDLDMGWIIPDRYIQACTYVPVIIGVDFIILALTYASILFVKWLNE